MIQDNCVLIKKSDLDEIKSNHPDKKLLEEVAKLKNTISTLAFEKIALETKVSNLLSSPVIKIDPMKINIDLMEIRSVYNQYSYTTGTSRYPFISGLNIQLDSKLKSQISSVSKLIMEKCISGTRKLYDQQKDADIKKLSHFFDKMSFIEMLKFFFNKNKYDIIKTKC